MQISSSTQVNIIKQLNFNERYINFIYTYTKEFNQNFMSCTLG